MTYVSQLPQAEQDAIKQTLQAMAALEGYTGTELEEAVQMGMDSKVADLTLIKVEKCVKCNKPTDDGFILNGDIHCSVECRRLEMTDDEYEAAHKEDDDSFYWTSWYGEEY